MLVLGVPVHAEVVRLEVRSRRPFAAGTPFGAVGAYETIAGRLHYAVDPGNAANARIVDLRYAPRDARGRVGFSGDFVLLKPVDLAKGSHRLFYEVNNRGNLGALRALNRGEGTNDPETAAHAGNGFLMRQGYSILWSAWNWDVLPGDGRLQIELPIATDAGRPITGRVVAEISVNEASTREAFAWGDSRGYEVVDAATNRDATLTVRDEQRSPREEIPRDRWRFSDATHVQLDAGFLPGRLYELVYTAKDPRVVGLGLAAIRDAISFFRFVARDRAGAANPLWVRGDDGPRPDPEKALIFGISQSGRVIQHMLFQGFHVDEAGRMVFEAALPHVAGAGKGSFNHRFAQTTRHPSELEDHQYPADFFPFTTTPSSDPVTGESGDVLAVAKAMGKVPVIMYTGSATEYWTRATSPLHTDVTGTKDVALDEHVRVYFVAGAQHGIAASRDRVYENPVNPLDWSPVVRALLPALDRWATSGALPPESVYPRIDHGELVTAAAYRDRFPRLPRVRLPWSNLQPPRLDLGPRFENEGIIDPQPPRFGPAYVTLVPDVDADGNDKGGIRLPDVSVPLGTYTGWNLRRPAMGAPDHLARWSGSFFAFARTEQERRRSSDPRPSIEARYPSRDEYVKRVEAAAAALVRRGFLLEEDAAMAVERARRLPWPPV
jgi:Alpha/beta hydrolase domain